ncbi:hypothetical protein GCM10028791_42840 [Echinicola sediminis]
MPIGKRHDKKISWEETSDLAQINQMTSMKMMQKIAIILLLIISLACSKSRERKMERLMSAPPNITICAISNLVSDSEWYNATNKAPLFDGMEVLHFPISTTDTLAQKYFNQALVLSYAFNHAEAARSFYYASKLDPECAMAYWGYAYVLGPNYNAGMEADNYERAYEAAQKALELSAKVSPKEKALINALVQRYTKEAPEDRAELDRAYSNAMKKVHEQFPEDADIAALYAESLMDQHPWDLWDKEGQPKPWTPEILGALEQVFQIAPKHPGAHHFYIHAVEASFTPELANSSAEAFDNDLVPHAGHLLHMPSHVYIRTGEYHKGTLANIRAVEADSIYTTTCHAQGAYPLAYFPHNYHFMAATATLEGNSRWALEGAEKLAENTNKLVMREPGWGTLQHYYTIPYYVYVKFGKWDKILEMNTADAPLPYPEAIQAYARGMAQLGKGHLPEAKMELEKLEAFAADTSFRELTIWDINSVYELLQIAQRVLKAEIMANEADYSSSIALLREAVAIEDQLNYNEPPDWFFSVRHHLGAVQLASGQFQEAIATYQEDLKNFPKNGWALHGLKTAYEHTANSAALEKVNKALQEAWKHADVKLEGSRISQ